MYIIFIDVETINFHNEGRFHQDFIKTLELAKDKNIHFYIYGSATSIKEALLIDAILKTSHQITSDNYFLIDVFNNELKIDNETFAAAHDKILNTYNLEKENQMFVIADDKLKNMVSSSPHIYVVADANEDVQQIAKRYTSAIKQSGASEAILDFIFRIKI